MEKIVPILSTGTVGPLGVFHLPRLWAKLLINAQGRLPAGYRHGAGGMDQFVTDSLGIDIIDFIHYVESELPTYPECEAWVRAHATNLNDESIAKINENLGGRRKTENLIGHQLQFVGLEDNGLRSAIVVNDLDDWATLHAQVTKGVLPPLIASSLNSEFGELLKELLNATGTNRAAMKVDLPSHGFHPVKPEAEIKARGSAAATSHPNVDDTPIIEFLRKERRAMIQDGLPMVGPVFLNGNLVAWITVHASEPRKWTAADGAALERATALTQALLEEVVRS